MNKDIHSDCPRHVSASPNEVDLISMLKRIDMFKHVGVPSKIDIDFSLVR